MKNVIEELGVGLENLPRQIEDTVIREGISGYEAEKWQAAVVSEDRNATSFRVKMTLSHEPVFLRLDVSSSLYLGIGLVVLAEEAGEKKSAMIYKVFEKIAGKREKNRDWVASDLSRYRGGRHLRRKIADGAFLEEDRVKRQNALMRAFEFAEALKTISHDLVKVEPAESTI